MQSQVIRRSLLSASLLVALSPAARPDTDFDVFPAQRIALAGYGLLHARVSWPLARGWELEARVENLFDREYELAHAFNTPGRSGTVALRWRGDR